MIPLGLFYALTTFHRFVNDVLHSLLDNYVVVFLASSCSPVLNRHTDYAGEVLKVTCSSGDSMSNARDLLF